MILNKSAIRNKINAEGRTISNDAVHVLEAFIDEKLNKAIDQFDGNRKKISGAAMALVLYGSGLTRRKNDRL